jgi:signal transduction histidine kinase
VLTELVTAFAEAAPSIPVLASHISHDAALALAVLRCARQAGLAPGSPATGRLTLAGAVEKLGPDFIRLLVLSAQPGEAPVGIWETGIRVAHLARLIAARTQLCGGEEAWLAGLAHNLHEYPQFADAGKREDWLGAVDAGGFVADAVRFCRAAPARVKSAHPLVRVLQLAVSLVYSVQAGSHFGGNVSVVGARTALSGLGLEAAEAARLQTEAEALSQETFRRYASDHDTALSGSLVLGYAALARAAALNEAMGGAHDRQALARAARLLMQGLFGIEASVLLLKQPGCTVPAAWWPIPDGLTALPLPVDEMQSALCRAGAGETVCWQASRADQFPVVDAQVARLLGVSAMLCNPLGQGYVLITGNAGEDMQGDPGWQSFLRALSARVTVFEARAGADVPAAGVPAADAIPRQEVRKAVHEAANPLTIIRNYVELLSGKFSRDSETQRDLAIIGGEIERVATILQGLGAKREAAGQPEDMPGTWVDVNQVISELVRLSLDTLFLPNKINVQIDLESGMGSILARRDQLKQVLLNLAKNAVEAMPRGGKLTFSTALAEHQGRPCAVIAVHDTGPGLPEAVRAQLFQPVPSFKGGEHAGLGLAISQNLVQSMGGNMEYDSTPDGATFRIYLPMPQANPAALHAGRP